jgi:hypothetical protein
MIDPPQATAARVARKLPGESVAVDIDPMVLAKGVRSRRGRPQNRTEVF